MLVYSGPPGCIVGKPLLPVCVTARVLRVFEFCTAKIAAFPDPPPQMLPFEMFMGILRETTISGPRIDKFCTQLGIDT